MTPLKQRDLRLLLLAVGLSTMGDVLAAVALTIRVHDETGSGLAVSLLLLADLVAHVAFAPWAGALVDRVETVRVLVLTASGQMVLAAALAFTNSVPLLVAMLFLVGAGATVVTPAILALVPRVVDEQITTPANAYLEIARYSGATAGPAVAGLLTALGGTSVALLADAASFGVLAALAATLRVRRHPEALGTQDVSPSARPRHVREGFRFLWGEPVLRLTSVVLMVTVMFAVMDNVALVFFAKDTLGAGGYATMISVWTGAMVVGIFLVARRLPARALALAVLLADTVTGGAVLVAAAWPLFTLALALFVVGGAGNGIANVARRSLIHSRAPSRLHGRVFAANAALLNTGQIAAVALGGVLVEAIGPRGTLLFAGAGTVLVTVAGLIFYTTLPASVRAPPERESRTPPSAAR